MPPRDRLTPVVYRDCPRNEVVGGTQSELVGRTLEELYLYWLGSTTHP